METQHEYATLSRHLCDQDAEQVENEAREAFETNLLTEPALFQFFAKEFMDSERTWGSFLDWCWEQHKRGQERIGGWER